MADDGTIKLSDLGLVRQLDRSSELTRTLEGVGTPRFMAPEQLRAEEPDRRTDVYALGVTLYEMLGLELPLQVRDPKARVDQRGDQHHRVTADVLAEVLDQADAAAFDVQPGRFVRLSVTDNGKGIPVTEHKRIFQKFYRIDDRLAREQEARGAHLEAGGPQGPKEAAQTRAFVAERRILRAAETHPPGPRVVV